MLVIGFDPGTSTSTLSYNDQTTGQMIYRTIPSFMVKGKPSELTKFRPDETPASLFKQGDYILEHKSTKHFVGKLSLEDSRATNRKGDPTRYTSDFSLRLLLTLLGSLVDAESISIKVVTGLPISLHNKENVKKIRELYIQNHTFKINDREMEVRILDVAVIFEGGGALLAHGNDKPGEAAVIDIGGRTTDLFWIQRDKEGNMRPNHTLCSGEAHGVLDAIQTIADLFSDKLKRRVTEQEKHQLMEYYLGRADKPELSSAGVDLRYNMEDINNIMEDTADDILSFVASIWGEDGEHHLASRACDVLLIGGGAYYFEKFIRERIPHLKVPAQPEIANTKGYLKLGESLSEEQWTQFHITD